MINLFKKKPDNNEPSLDDILQKLEGLKRSTWVPIVSDGDGDILASKFSGLPWLSESEEWPVCPNCSKPMQLFVQLNLSTLPHRPEGCPDKGLVQLFYCTSSEPLCESDCEAFFPWSKSVVARLISAEGENTQLDKTPVEDAFPPKLITGWNKKDDYPNWEEIETNGIQLTDPEFEKLDEAEAPVLGDKLLGWPAWVQGVEYPDCPTCGKKMNLLFQIDSECNLPYMFGDVGCGHMTQCSSHPEKIAFGWACS
jgi:uncharacterized protein YwqG